MGLEPTTQVMNKMLIKKAVGEGVSSKDIISEYGHKETVKALLQIVRAAPKTNAFYHKCLDFLKELEPQSREEYPELWI